MDVIFFFMVLFMELNIQMDPLFPSLELGGTGHSHNRSPPWGEKLPLSSLSPADKGLVLPPPCKPLQVPCNVRGGVSEPPMSPNLIHSFLWNLEA